MTQKPESKIQKALRLFDSGTNAHAAAIQAELKPSAVYAALKRRRDRDQGRCSCCGAPVGDDGKYVPRTGD